jgi:S-adenosylmethionine decarboxylase
MTVGHNSVHFTRGKHLILDLWGCDNSTLTNTAQIEETMKSAAVVAGATVLFSNMHHFGGEYGVTGVVGLAESHMSIHTYPEHGYASLDVYMCGNCDPRNTLETLKAYFKPTEVNERVLVRGEKWESMTDDELANDSFGEWISKGIDNYLFHFLIFVGIPFALFFYLM